MQNFAGQEISNRDFVAQVARTNKGIVRRVGVVLGQDWTEEGLRLRTAWYDPEETNTWVSESVVSIDNLVKIDPNTIPNTMRIPLEYARTRGHAAL